MVRVTLIAAAVGLASLVFLALWPGTFGFDRDALTNSVNDEVEIAGQCREKGDDWICGTPSGGGTAYAVNVNRMGCWTGERIAPQRSADGPQSISACVRIPDQIGFLNLDFGGD